MAARLLDGAAVAQAIRAEVGPAVAAFTARAGRPPGLGIVLVGDDPASEIYVRNKLKSAGGRRTARRSHAAACRRVARGSARGGRTAESQRGARRHPGAVAAAGGDGRRGGAARVRRDPVRQRRGRLSSRQRRPAGAEPRDAGGVHAVRGDRAARTVPGADCRCAGGRDRTERHRRQADGAAAAASACHGHDLPLADQGSAAGRGGGRHSRRRDRPGRLRDAGVRQARRGGGRRRHQPGVRPGGGRTAVSAGLETARGVRAPRLNRGR